MPFAVTMVSISWLYGVSRPSIKLQSEVGVCLEKKKASLLLLVLLMGMFTDLHWCRTLFSINNFTVY